MDAVANGEAQSFINDVIHQLLRGPSAGSTALSIIPYVGVIIQWTSILGDLFSNNISRAVVEIIVNNLSLTPATTSDLSPVGGYMQGIVNQGTGTPKVQIWGNETDPLLWRLAGTFSGENNTDDNGVSIANTAIDIYNTAADIEYAMSWALLPLHDFFDWRGDEWMEGKLWIRDVSNDSWAWLIGSASSQTVSGYTPRSICDEDYYYYYCDQAPDPVSCREACWIWEYYQYTWYSKGPSDGVVPDFSQRNDGGAWRDFIIEAPSLNHLELLRQNRVPSTLDRVFNGDNPNQGVFNMQ